jgi:hypothetical protein
LIVILTLFFNNFFLNFSVNRCRKSFKSQKQFKNHQINAHNQGIIFLCGCGYIATGPFRKDAHWNDRKKKLYQIQKGLKTSIEEHGNADYVFRHKEPIEIHTKHAEKYLQVASNSVPDIIKFFKENFNKIVENQKVYNNLNQKGIKAVDTDEELGLH